MLHNVTTVNRHGIEIRKLEKQDTQIRKTTEGFLYCLILWETLEQSNIRNGQGQGAPLKGIFVFLHFAKVLIFKLTNSDQALSWLLRHNAEKEGFVFLEGGFLPVQEVLKHKRCYFSVKQFLSKHFPDFEAGVIHWKMSRLLWLNVPNKGSRSKQAKR